jgi:hypothetical protein
MAPPERIGGPRQGRHILKQINRPMDSTPPVARTQDVGLPPDERALASLIIKAGRPLDPADAAIVHHAARDDAPPLSAVEKARLAHIARRALA